MNRGHTQPLTGVPTMRFAAPQAMRLDPCGECDGTGSTDTEYYCPVCGGTGMVIDQRELIDRVTELERKLATLTEMVWRHVIATPADSLFVERQDANGGKRNGVTSYS